MPVIFWVRQQRNWSVYVCVFPLVTWFFHLTYTIMAFWVIHTAHLPCLFLVTACHSIIWMDGFFLFLSPLEGYLWFPLHNDYLCFWPRLFLLVVVSPYQVSLQIPHLQGKCSEGGNGRRGTGGWQTIQTLSMSVAVMGKGKQGRSWKVMWGQYIFLLKWSKLYLCVLRMLKICILLTYSGRKTDDGGRGGDFLEWCPWAHETTQSVRHREAGLS